MSTIDTNDGVIVGAEASMSPEQIAAAQAAAGGGTQQTAFAVGGADPHTAGNGTQQAPAGQEQRTFTAEEVERFRQQERDKLYPTLEQERRKQEELEAQVAELTRFRQEQEQAAQVEAARVAAELRAAEEAEMSAIERIAAVEQRLRDEIAQERNAREMAEALLGQERNLAALEEYKRGIVAQHEDDIIPELRPNVRGNTREEIDASVAAAMEQSASIMRQIGQQRQAQLAGLQGVQPTGVPPTGGPLENLTQQRTLTPADIKAMPPEEYAKLRPQLMKAASDQHKALFG